MSATTTRRGRNTRHAQTELRPLSRLDPRDGLVIDAETWNFAHAYHQATARLHALAAHGPGVLSGLEVVPISAREIGILPGVGLDATGNPLVLPAAVRISLDTAGVPAGNVFILLVRSEEDVDDDGHVREESEIQISTELPEESHLELARVNLGTHADVNYAVDPRAPSLDQIDTRFRPQSGSLARGTIEVGDLSLPDAGVGHPGSAALLARAVNHDGVYRANFTGEVRMGQSGVDSGILYMTGTKEFALNEGAISWLRGFLDAGGTVIGDGCHSTAADPFGAAFDRLAKALGRQLRRVVAGDRLLWSHHAFGAAPPGTVKTDVGLILANNGVIYCASDYGCVLRGGADNPAPRAAMMAVEQFATNLAAHAYERTRGQSFAS